MIDETISLAEYFRANYEIIVIFALLLLEVALRKIPSYKDNSIVNKLLSLFDWIVKNNIKESKKRSKTKN